MKKFIYILIIITAITPISDRCLGMGNLHEVKETDRLPKAMWPNGEVLVYFREAPMEIKFIYLILKPYQHTYELYGQMLDSEIGTYELNGDTLNLTPKIGFEYVRGNWISVDLPSSNAADILNSPKQFIIKDEGTRLIDITFYNTYDPFSDTTTLQQWLSEYVLLNKLQQLRDLNF